jgi:hypothetical protein
MKLLIPFEIIFKASISRPESVSSNIDNSESNKSFVKFHFVFFHHPKNFIDITT